MNAAGLDLALLGVRIVRDANGLAGTLARAGVRVRALAAHRKTTTMTLTTVAVDTKKALHVLLNLTAKVTFGREFHASDGLGDERELVVGQLSRADVRINVGSREDLAAEGKTDAVDIGQRVFDFFVVRDINSKEACHKIRVLSL